jgi:hypothetical protein
MERIIRQLATAAAVLDEQSGANAVIIGWEWTSSLSPNGGDAHDKNGNISAMTRADWESYKRYISVAKTEYQHKHRLMVGPPPPHGEGRETFDDGNQVK